MAEDKKVSKAQVAMEKLAKPISSCERTGEMVKTIPYTAKATLDRVIEPKIRQNEIERREGFEEARDVIVKGAFRDKDELDPNRMVTSEECPDRMVRWTHNINALKHDAEAQMAMMSVREEKLNEIENQDLECVRRLRRRTRH